ncbi:MAG: ribosomal protein S18-alanine N-acetyltransferase [Bacilli bacterium]|nr:ribosomal protein S18-alanine N-acetyltransferase [Bacilli bacterium]
MIRPLELDDLNFVNKLINDSQYIINEYELNKSAYIYVKDNKIIAFISYLILYERAELNYIYVDPNYREQHIASTLMDDMFRNCQKSGVNSIDLEVNVSNEKAINLYKKYGFKIVNIRKNYYNGFDAYVMLKEIR